MSFLFQSLKKLRLGLDHIHFYADAIKIILSMESPKTLPPEHQLQFDGYLQKPASLSHLIAEVNHL